MRARLRHCIERINAGDLAPLRALLAADVELTFPGFNSWARQFRDPRRTRAASVTHRAVSEVEALARRGVDASLTLEVDEIVVTGPPWRTSIVVRGTESATDNRGHVVYENRHVIWIDARWGTIRRWEVYLDTERVSMWDDCIAAGVAPQIDHPSPSRLPNRPHRSPWGPDGCSRDDE